MKQLITGISLGLITDCTKYASVNSPSAIVNIHGERGSSNNYDEYIHMYIHIRIQIPSQLTFYMARPESEIETKLN